MLCFNFILDLNVIQFTLFFGYGNVYDDDFETKKKKFKTKIKLNHNIQKNTSAKKLACMQLY